MSLTIGELVGFLDLETKGWDRGTNKAHQDMRSMHKDIDTLSDGTDKLAGQFLKLANNLSNIPTAMAAITGTATILANMSGALGLLPAAGAGAAVAIATLKIGVAGFGDALKNAGDPEKFAESLKTLSPNAREAAVAIRDLAPAWNEVKKAVQDELFSGVGTTIRQVGGTYMPILKTGLKDVAAGFDDAAYGARSFFMDAQTQKDIAGLFQTTSGSVGDLSGALQPALEILRDLIAVGMEFLPGLTGGFGDAAQRAADFVAHARETGQLKQWISEGLSTIGDVVKLLKQLGQIAATVFGGLNAGGTNMLDTLLKVTAQVRDFLQSFEGQQALRALGQALNTVSTVVTQVLLEAFRQLAPIIVQLAPGFAELARQVGSALRVAGPLLQGLARFISENIDWLGPLAIALLGAVKAFEAVSVAIRVISALAATNPWLILIAATVALVMLIITHWDQIKAALGAAWDWIKSVARSVWEGIKNVIIDPIKAAWDKITEVFGKVVDFFADLPRRIGEALQTLGETLLKPFQWARDQITRIIDLIVEDIDRMTGRLNRSFNTGWSLSAARNPATIAGNGGHQFRAAGGPVAAGRSYWVGEEGKPELFTPGASGFITPLDEMGGRASVHIDEFHAHAGQSPDEIAAALDWAARGGGY